MLRASQLAGEFPNYSVEIRNDFAVKTQGMSRVGELTCLQDSLVLTLKILLLVELL